MTIAVSGASGHVGANLIRMLADKGYRIKALCRDDVRALNITGLEKVKGDMLDPDSIDSLVSGCEAVIHMAARISISDREDPMVEKVNVEGTRNITDAALKHKVRKFVHFSSIHAYQSFPQNEVLDETRPNAGSHAHCYDRSKAGGEAVVLQAVQRGLDAVILNPTSVLGPHDYKPSFSGQFLIKLYNRKLPALVEGGFDWVDARDVSLAALNAIEKGRTGEKYLCSGHWLTVKDMADAVARVTGLKMPGWICPHPLVMIGLPFLNLHARMSGKDQLYTRTSLKVLREGHPSISYQKAARELGYAPRPIDETLADTFRWFIENKYLVKNDNKL